MAYDNARPLPPVPDAPHHDKHLKPWVVAGLTVIIVLGIVAWNMQDSIDTVVTTTPNTATGAPASK